MKRLPEGCSMYEAVQLNPSGSTVRTALSFFGRRYSFEEVLARIDLLADNLAADLGIKKGDVVTLCLPNSPAAVFALYAVNKLGGVVSPAHPLLPPEKLADVIRRTNSRLLIVSDSYTGDLSNIGVRTLVSDNARYMDLPTRMAFRLFHRPSSRGESLEKYLRDRKNPRVSACAFAADEPAVYLSSGGTTGEPKIIVHGNDVFNRLCCKAEEFLSRPLGEYSAIYDVVPIFHGYGLCMNVHMCMLMRRTNVLCLRFSARRCAKEIVRTRANILMGVPTMFRKLLSEPAFTEADLSHIKDVYVGGDDVPQPLIDAFDAVLARGGSSAHMYVGYGMTEAVNVCFVNTRAHHRAGSVGYPLSGTRAAIVREGKSLPAGETGEICLSSDQFMLGYLGEPAAFSEREGTRWLATGDCGYLDEDGFLYFKQRIKNVLKVSGVPVYPSEVEAAALSVAGVAKACAVGETDALRGQAVCLFVECEPGADRAACRKNIEQMCARRLIRYARPRRILFEDALPLSAVGKIDRVALEAKAKQAEKSRGASRGKK